MNNISEMRLPDPSLKRDRGGARHYGWALFALAAAAFGIGTTEFVIMGLLPDVAKDLGATIPQAGLLVTGYALGVTFGGPVLALMTAKADRRKALLFLVGIFILGNLLCAIAPNYPTMLLGRVVAALCHGTFFGIGSLVARRLVPPERASRAVAMMFAGLTVANVLGVPFGALVGERWGWRATFWAITATGAVALAAIAVLVPGWAGRVSGGAGGLRAQLRSFRSTQVWLTLTATALGYGGMFGAFSYLAYTFTEVTGFSTTDVAWLLVVYGTGLVVGNIAGGRGADHNRDVTLLVSLTGLAATLTAFGLLASSRPASVILVFLLGAFGFATVPGMITRVTDAAGGVPLAASANVSASNVGNAVGAWLGGLVISAGWGYSAPLFVGAGIVGVGVAVMGWDGASELDAGHRP